MTKYDLLAADLDQVAEWQRLRDEVAASGALRGELLSRLANDLRREIIQMISAAGLGHVGGDFSVVDVLTCLYFAVARIDPSRPRWEERDRVVLSKGHAAVSLYATLARCGFFPRELLSNFAQPLSPLNGHPDRRKVPGVEASTGPLGHGLPFSVGAAIGARIHSSSRRVFVILGDGELQEGSNWEAAMLAGHRKLDNLVAVVDRNGLQQGARTEETNGLEPLVEKWVSFGWEVEELCGHSHEQLVRSLYRQGDGRPRCLIARTTKGKGVSFMEDQQVWHHRVPNLQEVELALRELGA